MTQTTMPNYQVRREVHGFATVTAYGDDESRRRAKDLSALEFITKPADCGLLKA